MSFLLKIILAIYIISVLLNIIVWCFGDNFKAHVVLARQRLVDMFTSSGMFFSERTINNIVVFSVIVVLLYSSPKLMLSNIKEIVNRF
jgi:uncharacterized membrane protein